MFVALNEVSISRHFRMLLALAAKRFDWPSLRASRCAVISFREYEGFYHAIWIVTDFSG